MSDVHAERAQGALMDPADPWGTLVAHVGSRSKGRGPRGCKCSRDQLWVWPRRGAVVRRSGSLAKYTE